jgi:hypothetical protein
MVWRGAAAVLFGVVVAALAGVAVVVGRARRAHRIDRHRTAVLAADRMLDLTAPGFVPLGPVSTVVGGGEGPWLRRSEARRHFSTPEPPEAAESILVGIADAAGWSVRRTGVYQQRVYVRASRRDHGFGESLELFVTPERQGGSEVRVVLQAGPARSSPGWSAGVVVTPRSG